MFSGEIKEGDEYECRGNLRTSEEPRFSYQLQEKQPTTTKTPRILRFSIQHFNDDNRTTSTKIEENNKSNKTSEEINHDLLMSMDCESYRKDDCSHTCNRRSSTPPPFSSKRFSTESSHPTSKLGRSVSPNKKKLRRSGMVGRIFRNQQWITNPQRRLQFTASSGYIRGRIRQWIRNKQRRNRDLRVLDPSRESNVNKRKRTTDSIDSPATSRRKISKQSHKDIFGQHDGNQIRDEGRRNSISDFTGFSSENPYNSQPVQNTITMCPYPGDQQHQSRSIKQNAKTAIRMDIAKVHIQSNSTQVGSIDDRCIRSSPQSSSTEILEYQAGPSSNANRCFQTTMAENRVVSTSTMEISSSSAENVQEAEGEGSDIGDSILANTILVPNDIENDKEKTTDIPNLKNLAASRMEIIRQSMEKQNLDLTTINHLQHKHRKETINNYNRNWERWANWCSQQSPTINYLEYAPKNVLKYLVQNRHYSTSHLNGIRSSIASVFNVVYPSKPSIGQHHLIQDFFTAHKKQRVQIPTREEIEIWDLDILLKFIKAKYAHNDRLTIMELQYKTVLLLSIFTMWRPKSDISRLQHRDVLFQTENGRIQGVTLICRLPKEAQQKTISLGTIDTSDLCPVTTLYLFIQKTEGYRGKLPENQTLFLAYINEQKPTSCVSPNTVTGWIKNNMSQAGIDTTKYQPHSIRSAASTKAVQLGFKIDDDQYCNWEFYGQ
ncbi:hypothetical protein G6F17_012182 [Rhizopus arrhizus]|nr:hypothetical protein G6F17_012182 [Rhizopus arrhizus]